MDNGGGIDPFAGAVLYGGPPSERRMYAAMEMCRNIVKIRNYYLFLQKTAKIFAWFMKKLYFCIVKRNNVKRNNVKQNNVKQNNVN